MERKIILMRHAKPDVAGAKRCIGMTDLPLGEEGRQQAVEAGKWLRCQNIAEVYSSPLMRCLQTAGFAKVCTSPIRVVDELHEMETGAWENLSFAEIRTRYPKEYEARGKDIGYYAPPGGESFYQAGRRFCRGMNGILANTKENILIVAHAGVIRAYLCMLQNRSLDQVFTLPQPYTGISVLKEKDGKLQVEKTGSIPGKALDQSSIEKIYEECSTSKNVIAHMQAVAEVVKQIVDDIDPMGALYDKDLLVQSALVHDIARRKKDHAAVGAAILQKEGYEEAAALIAEHHSDRMFDSQTLTMSEILFYADKRVRESQIVSVEERFEESRKKCLSKEAVEKHQRLYLKTIYIEKKIKNLK